MKLGNQLPEIRKTVVLKAPVDKVWNAVATSDGIAAWFMANTFQPVQGHEFVLKSGPYGDSTCRVTELDPPHKVAFEWDKDWRVEFHLRDRGDGTTEFTLIHSGWDADKVTPFGQPYAVVRGVMDGGWEKKVRESLPTYLEG